MIDNFSHVWDKTVRNEIETKKIFVCNGAISLKISTKWNCWTILLKSLAISHSCEQIFFYFQFHLALFCLVHDWNLLFFSGITVWKDYSSQVDQVYYCRIFTNTTTIYKLMYTIYKHTIFLKLLKMPSYWGLVWLHFSWVKWNNVTQI